MGLFSGGNSKKKTTINNDNRALNAAGNTGQAVMGEGNEVNVTYSDHGAVEAAFDYAGDVTGAMSDAVDSAFGFGDGAIEAVQESSLAALEFGESSLREGFGFAESAMDHNARVNDRAFDAMEASSDAAFSFVNNAFESALDESAQARAEAFTTISETNKRVDEFYKTSGRETAADSMKIIKWMAFLVGAGLAVGVIRRA